MKPLGEPQLALFRRHMVELIDMHYELASEEIGGDAVSPRLRAALLEVRRHLFVPHQLALAAYQDTPLPIGFDKTVSQPFIGALMIDMLEIEPGMRVLEIGTGLGYQAAVMATLGARVSSVEIVEEFAEGARLRLEAEGHDVEIRIGDGNRGWPDRAPFDRVLVTAAAEWPPQPLVDQLRIGGRIVMPLGSEDVQHLTALDKTSEDSLDARPALPARFTRLESAA